MRPKELVEFLGIIGRLKSTTRHVWAMDGRQESVAEHCWRLAVIALLIADEFPGLDMQKVLKMCLIHDFGEAITGDIPSFFKTKQDEDKEELAIAGLIERLSEGLSESTAKEFAELFAEMAELDTEEAKLFKALDKLEAIISHNESPLDTWLELEHTENQTYGTEEAAHFEYLARLRELIRNDTILKIEEHTQVPCD